MKTSELTVLVLGSGGREHALCVALRGSDSCARVLCAPGNPGMRGVAECLDADTSDHASVAELAESNGVDLVVVGPEAPLVAGIANDLRAKGLAVFGTDAAGAQLEASKAWAADFMSEFDIPQPTSATFTASAAAIEYVLTRPLPIVVKADGLAAGKGVSVCATHEDATAAITALMDDRKLGPAGNSVVVQDCVPGRELSVFVLLDGNGGYAYLPGACDYKRLRNGNEGPNTGGMGSLAPAPMLDSALQSRVHEAITQPLIAGLRERDIDYRGILYIGLMITPEGDPVVIEFNVRFGDPEAQVVLPLIKSDVGLLLLHTALGDLGKIASVDLHAEQHLVCVTLASANYAEGPTDTGHPIHGIDDAEALEGVHIIAAGVGEQDGMLINTGGRVISVLGGGNNFEEARQRVYAGVACISFAGMQHRTDIAEEVG